MPFAIFYMIHLASYLPSKLQFFKIIVLHVPRKIHFDVTFFCSQCSLEKMVAMHIIIMFLSLNMYLSLSSKSSYFYQFHLIQLLLPNSKLTNGASLIIRISLWMTLPCLFQIFFISEVSYTKIPYIFWHYLYQISMH